MLSYEKLVYIHLAKRYGEKFTIEKLNPRQYKKLIGVWKNPLGYITNYTTDLQNKIQEWKIL